VRDLRPFVESGPDTRPLLALEWRARDPQLTTQVRDVHAVRPGERVAGRHGEAQAAFGEHLELRV
jgi:hypothetical protein